MKKNLVEHIIDEEYVEASDVFAGTLSSILEQKLYEMKRSIDLTEVVKKTRKKNEDGNPVYTGYNTKADWAKYRKQNPSMSFHGTPANPKAKAPEEKKEKTSTGTITKYGLAQRRKRGYLPAADAINAMNFIKGVQSHLRSKIESSDKKKISESSNFDFAAAQAETERLNKELEAKKRLAHGMSAPEKGKPQKGFPSELKGKTSKPGGTSGSKYLNPNKMTRTPTSNERIRRHIKTIMTGRDEARSGAKSSRLKAAGELKKVVNSIPGVQKARNIAGSVMQSPWEVTHSESVMNEVITAKTPVSSVIRDFVHSRNKKFKGDSKKKRIKRALGAYYSMHEAKAWKDLSQEAKKHPFGKSKNNPLTKRRRKRRLVKRIFNEE